MPHVDRKCSKLQKINLNHLAMLLNIITWGSLDMIGI